MRCYTRRVLFGGALAAIAGAALAQPYGPGMMGGPGPGGPGGGPGMGGGPGLGRMGDPAAYLDSLKAELGITAAQMPAWNAYAETVIGVATQMQGVHQTMWDAMGTATWQERRDMMNNMFNARQQAFDMVHGAAAKLQPALTPAQRTQAATTLPGLMTPGPMGPGMRRGGMWHRSPPQ